MEENVMEIRYKIFEKLRERGIPVKEFRENLQFGNSMISKMQHNKNVTIETIGKVCEYLQCPIEDVVEISYMPDANLRKKQELEAEKAEYEKKLMKFKKKLTA